MVISHFMTEGYMDIQKEYIISRACTYLMVLYNRHFAVPSLLPYTSSPLLILQNPPLQLPRLLPAQQQHRPRSLLSLLSPQSALYNCILRVYVTEKQYLTATNFIASAPFPENVSDKQYIRYSYYKG